MNRKSFVALAMVLAVGLELAPRPAAAAEAIGFPDFTKKDEMDACLFGYGTENTSIVDCIARDEKFKGTLSKLWPSLDDRFKTECVARLAKRHLNSYYYLDHCIQSAQHDAAAPQE